MTALTDRRRRLVGLTAGLAILSTLSPANRLVVLVLGATVVALGRRRRPITLLIPGRPS